MSRYLPSFKGWVALILALFASIYLPNTFPARVTSSATGVAVFSAPVPLLTWVIAAITAAVCLGASVLAAVRGRAPDRIAAAFAALLIVVLIVVFATTHKPNKALQATAAVHLVSYGFGYSKGYWLRRSLPSSGCA